MEAQAAQPANRILVIDDNPSIHEDFRKVLSPRLTRSTELDALEQELFGAPLEPRDGASFDVDSAFQGAEGLDKIRRAAQEGRPYTMAFVDVRMPPGWDGIETVQRIWQEFPEFQVVICTAYSDYTWQDISQRLKQIENLLILKKPFDDVEVVQLAHALSEKWRLGLEAARNVEHLEQTVRERTRELQMANDELREQIAQRERAEVHLRQLALYDSLTGLPNRNNLQCELQLAIDRARRGNDRDFAVLFVDLDRFKSINDRFGHEAGDQLLRDFADRIKGALRDGDTVEPADCESTTGRLGGDEFVVLLRNMNEPAQAQQIAERLLRVLEQPYQISGQSVHATPSIGVAYFDPRYVSANEMLRDADTAMYEAKSRGGAGIVVFDHSMLSAIQQRLELENDLWNALDANQFFLAYQPIWGLVDGRLCGVEALLRWNHPTKGLIPPDLFIPIAEQTKLIVPIGAWVFDEAFRQFKEWKQLSSPQVPQYISVNLSRVQLGQPDLVANLRQSLQQHGMSGEELQIEITESHIMENPRLAKETLLKIKELGVRLAIDDFGTGHSTLSCLYEFHLDVLKIDQSFISRLNEGRANLALIDSIIRLAKNLGLECVAEGVEQREQLQQLGHLGCSGVQGFLLGKPMRCREIETEFLNEGQPTRDAGGADDREAARRLTGLIAPPATPNASLISALITPQNQG